MVALESCAAASRRRRGRILRRAVRFAVVSTATGVAFGRRRSGNAARSGPCLRAKRRDCDDARAPISALRSPFGLTRRGLLDVAGIRQTDPCRVSCSSGPWHSSRALRTLLHEPDREYLAISFPGYRDPRILAPGDRSVCCGLPAVTGFIRPIATSERACRSRTS